MCVCVYPAGIKHGLLVVVRPHQVLHHQASHVIVHEVPQQLIFARSLIRSTKRSSWELEAELKHVSVNATAMSKLPALPLWSIERCFNPTPNQICYSPAQATYVYSKHAVQREKLLAPSAWTRMMSVWKSMRHPTISTAAPCPGITPVWAHALVEPLGVPIFALFLVEFLQELPRDAWCDPADWG